jgi:hypothetical protein
MGCGGTERMGIEHIPPARPLSVSTGPYRAPGARPNNGRGSPRHGPRLGDHGVAFGASGTGPGTEPNVGTEAGIE